MNQADSKALTEMEWAALKERVRAEGLRLGFEAVGFTTAEPLDEATQRRWRRWIDSEMAGEMTWLLRERPRRTHPEDLLPGARSAVVALASYYQGDPPEPPPASSGERAGRVARYAWGEDYHYVLRERMERLALLIREASPGAQCRAAVDSAPLDERALAVRAGLGFFGKNTLLIRPGVGSWTLIAVLLTTAPFPPDTPGKSEHESSEVWSCGACRRCLDACPTGALVDAHKLDPRRCVSYLTIESKQEAPRELAEKMTGWVFGCDDCQTVCPFNAAPPEMKMEEFKSEKGAGPWFDEGTLAATPSGKSFEKKWARSPIVRAGLKGMKRNLTALTRDATEYKLEK